jgi:hypothetical protein
MADGSWVRTEIRGEGRQTLAKATDADKERHCSEPIDTLSPGNLYTLDFKCRVAVHTDRSALG